MPEITSRPQLDEPNWYRGHYLLAVAFANVAQAQDKARENEKEKEKHKDTDKDLSLEIPDDLREAGTLALDQVRSVALALESKLENLDQRRRPSGRERALSEFLGALEPTVLLLLAGTIRRWGSPAGSSKLSNGDISNRRLLVDALEMDALEDGDIIKYVQGLHLDYRAQYNLACYYAGLGDKEQPEALAATEGKASDSDDECPPTHMPPPEYVRAFSQLAGALKAAPVDVVKWAQDDPSLAGLRCDEVLGPRLAKLIKELTTVKEAPRKVPGSPMSTRPQ